MALSTAMYARYKVVSSTLQLRYGCITSMWRGTWHRPPFVGTSGIVVALVVAYGPVKMKYSKCGYLRFW